MNVTDNYFISTVPSDRATQKGALEAQAESWAVQKAPDGGRE